MEDYREKISKFISFFSKQLDIICNAKFSENEKLYKKILYIGIIDAISKSVCPQKGNRKRFVSFVTQFSEWKDCERISLTHLAKLLEKVPDTEIPELREFVHSNFNWREGDTIYLDKDPDYNTIRNLWPRDKESLKQIGDVAFESLTHVHLFYQYRNMLIHELRKPGYGMEYDDDDSPFYHSMRYRNDNNKKTWELVYPLGFYKIICGTLLKNLETYCINNRINPYNSYTFGTYFIDELNS